MTKQEINVTEDIKDKLTAISSLKLYSKLYTVVIM